MSCACNRRMWLVPPGIKEQLSRVGACAKRCFKAMSETGRSPKACPRDRLDQSEAVCKLLPALGVSFRDLQPCPTTVVFKDYDVDLDGSSRLWRWFRIWSLISISGLWPLCVFGAPDMPLQFESCSLCGTQSTEVYHVVTCPGTQDFFNSFRCDMFFQKK